MISHTLDRISIANMVIGKASKQSTQSITKNNNKEMMQMRKRLSQSLIAFFAVMLVTMSFANTADARRYSGACGGGSTLADMIAGAKAHGVLDDMARKTGQTPGVDGSAAKIVKDNYVVVYVAKGVYVTNYTCSGGKFKKLGKKKFLPKGTKLYIPAKIAPKPGASKNISDAVQENCGNRATGKIKVTRKGGKKVSRPAPKKPIVTTPVVQTNDQAVGGAGNCNSTNAGNLTGPGAVQGSCNQVNVVCNGTGSCSPSTTQHSTSYQTCVNNGGSWSGSPDSNNGVCNVQETPPPASCEQQGNCPVPASARCDGLDVQTNPTVNRGVRAFAAYSATNATFTKMVINWGDGTTREYNADSAEYVYATAGNRVVSAKLFFTTASGGTLESNCADVNVTPKDGTAGTTTTTPGTAGGTGSGGTAGSTTTGSTCRNAAGDVVSGTPDKYGNCV